MEGPYYSNNNPKIPKIKGINGNVLPINAQMDAQFSIGRGRYHPSKSPTFDSYTSPNSLDNMDSTLLRYLRSGSSASAGIVPSAGDAFAIPVVDAAKYRPLMVHPYHSNINGNGSFGSRGSSASPLSAVENLETPPSRSPPVFKTPGKVEEEVLVMDGILVGLVTGARMRSASSDSGGSSSGNSLYKTEICRSWEDSGSCRYGSKCQFAHGKEELRPTRFAIKNKFEMCKSYGSSGSSCTHGPKCRFVHQAMSVEATKAVAATAQTAPSIKPQCADTITSRDWLPQDDGIEVVLPASSTHKPPAWEDVDAYIHDVLYSPAQRRRLPVFAEICPE